MLVMARVMSMAPSKAAEVVAVQGSHRRLMMVRGRGLYLCHGVFSKYLDWINVSPGEKNLQGKIRGVYFLLLDKNGGCLVR